MCVVGNCKTKGNAQHECSLYFRSSFRFSVQQYLINTWFYTLIAVAAVQLLWLLILFIRPLLLKKPDQTPAPDYGVTVVVVAKNEKENLQKLLPTILQQKFPLFEVIVVDDHSWDGTYEYLHELKASHPNFDLIALDDFVQSKPGKKLALTLAIKKAKHEVLLFTDADCMPASENWIAQMTAPTALGKEVVLGYSPYMRAAGLLNPFVRYEAFLVAWQYLAFALAGMPYMGVGRNLVYTKSKFMANKGFASHLKISYGDDDLLIQEIAKGKNTAVVLQPDAYVESLPKTKPGEWLKQKKRHLSAGKYYKAKFRFLLGLLWFSRLLYWVLAICYLAFATLSWAGIGVLLLPLLLQWIFAFVLHHKHKMFKLWPLFPLFDVIYQLLLYPLFGLIAALKPQKEKW
ncbi:glycosyltransferase [bacterium]|nr:glycosyltransferase [bacterium]